MQKITCVDTDFTKTKDAVINTLVSVELSLPMYHCFTGMVGASFEYGTLTQQRIPVARMFLLHPIHGASAEKTLDRKRNIIRDYYTSGIVSVPESNVDIQCIRLFDLFVVTEGNGRLAALKNALYDLEQKHLEINADVAELNKTQTDDVWKMVCAVWTSGFPNIDLEGWRHPMPLRRGEVGNDQKHPTQSNVEETPFNYGFVHGDDWCPSVVVR